MNDKVYHSQYPNKILGEANALGNKLSTTEKRCEELQSLLHNTVLENEILKSKLESHISILQNKVDCAEKQIEQLNKEVITLEEIVDSKNTKQEKRKNPPKIRHL